MAREVRVSAGGVYDLGYHVVWCRSRLPTLWSRSFFVATVGAASAATVRRYIDTQYERPWRKERTR